jgi:uncharacterized protein (DUF1800 family)
MRPPSTRRIPVQSPSRRTLLGGSGTQTQQLGGSASQSAPANPAGAPSSFGDYELFLAHHATQGFSTDELTRLRTMGGEAWLEEQLHPELIDDSACDTRLAAVPSVNMTGAQLYATYFGQQGGDNIVARELRGAVVIRAVHSKRQLFERLVEFIDDLLHVPQEQGALNFQRTLYDQAMRAHALGPFEDLLLESGKGGAMLIFLNNIENIVGAPNENYSRESMELHTLGAGVVYTETDVREAARAFTGWSTANAGPNLGAFVFRAPRHDDGAKFLPGLGLSIPAGGGVTDGEVVLRTLAQRPETIARLARRLLSWFVTYNPPQSAVNRVVARWNATGGELREVLGEVLSRTTVSLCAPWSPPKLKRPFHLVTGLLRQTQAVDQSTWYRGVVQYLAALGQTPFGWLPPNGYPDAEGAWGTSVLPRWQFVDALVQGDIQALQLSNAQVLALYGNVGAANVGARLSEVLAGGLLAAEDVADVQAYVDAAPLFNLQVFRDALALAASSPSYQRY